MTDVENVLDDFVELENFRRDEPKPTKLGMLVFAILSKASYSATPNDVLEGFGLSRQFQILRQYTNPDMLTVKDKSTGKVIVAVRGTDQHDKTGNRIRDLADDYRIATGENERVSRKFEVEKVVKRVIKRFGKDKVILTGHSLGAFVSTKISDDLGVKAVVFNIGSSPMDDTTGKNDDITHYTTNDVFKGVIDPLSVTSVLRDDYRTIKVKKKGGNIAVHSIDNFLPNKED